MGEKKRSNPSKNKKNEHSVQRESSNPAPEQKIDHQSGYVERDHDFEKNHDHKKFF